MENIQKTRQLIYVSLSPHIRLSCNFSYKNTTQTLTGLASPHFSACVYLSTDQNNLIAKVNHLKHMFNWYVSVPADKAPNNMISVCKIHDL
jgi:hypothetical protein